MLNRISRLYGGQTGQFLCQLAWMGLFSATLSGLAPNLRAQGCDCSSAKHATCDCGVVHPGHGSHCHHHQHCQAIGLLDRLDAFSNRMEAKLDHVFGRLALPGSKKHCQCGRCNHAASAAAIGVEMPYEPEDPAIADPVLNDSAAPAQEHAESGHARAGELETTHSGDGHSTSTTQDAKSGSSNTRKRLVPVPPPVIHGNKEIPTSIDASGRRPRAGVGKDHDSDATQESKPQGSSPKVRVPDWLNDPFKDDAASRSKAEDSKGVESSDGIRWTKRKTDDRTSSKNESLKLRGVVDATNGFRKLVWRSDETAKDTGAVQAGAVEENQDSVVRAAVSNPAQSTKPKWKEAEIAKPTNAKESPVQKTVPSVFNFRR